MLKTKSILAPIEESEGIRISIMSRHQWKPRIIPYTNVTKIEPTRYDLWQRQFAPPQKLVGNYYKRGLSFKEFEKEYITYIKAIYNEVIGLSKEALKKDITLLCLEDAPDECHRRLLAEECKKINPKLEVEIK